MSEAVISETSPRSQTIREKLCDVCGRESAEGLLPFIDLPDDFKSVVEANAATAGDVIQICPSCITLFSRARRQLESHSTVFEQNSYVLPTPLRLDADERFTGRGMTIAFLDSGFYSHPDLTTPRNRILA